tara:strand:+ start:398 stop:637 length:240 start_codon:yes stop_codon:yes gene_type:complete
MTKDSKNNSKKCAKNKKVMIGYGVIQLASRLVSALALSAIALGFCSLNEEARLFNECVEELIDSGSSASSAVRFCNGGN